MTELRNLRGRINELESDLRERDEEVKILKEQQLKLSINGSQDDSETIRVRSFLLVDLELGFCRILDLTLFNGKVISH